LNNLHTELIEPQFIVNMAGKKMHRFFIYIFELRLWPLNKQGMIMIQAAL